MDALSSVVGWLANIIQIISAAFAIVAAIGLWRTRRKLKRVLLGLQKKGQPGAVALAIGVGSSIAGNVQHYLETVGLDSLHVEELTYSGTLPRDKFYDFLTKVQEKKESLIELGVTEVHLFYMGPVSLAMGIGSIFDNWVPVIVYNLNKQTGLYSRELTLGKGAVLGLLHPRDAEA